MTIVAAGVATGKGVSELMPVHKHAFDVVRSTKLSPRLNAALRNFFEGNCRYRRIVSEIVHIRGFYDAAGGQTGRTER